jgi:RNA polymerase sigma-54 factor
VALKQRLNLSQRQKLALTPDMRTSLTLLRMPTDSLREEIAREAAQNPFLVVEERRGGRSGYDVALDLTEATVSLHESLSRQIRSQRLLPAVEAAALFLASELREDGYLDVTLQDLSDGAGVPLDVLDQGLRALHRCDPPGIGARSLAECLMLQLTDVGMDADTAATVVEHLEDFANGRWAALSRALRLPVADLQAIAATIRALSYAPVQKDPGMVAARIPELIVQADGSGTPKVALHPAALPRVAVMQVASTSASTTELQQFLSRAASVANGVAARAETLLRIGHRIAEEQALFFQGNHDTIQPVSRAEMAAHLSMHPSTLGRAVAGKSLMANGKVYDLAQFFSRALPGPNGAISAFDTQRRIHALISAENSAHPLADDEICAHLQKEGVDIKRRTVAKYRKCMRIPSSYERRRRAVSHKGPPRKSLREGQPRK